MNLLLASLLYHPDDVPAITKDSRVGLQNQINSFQWAVVEGLRKNLLPGETLSILNAVPVGVFPRQHRKLFLRSQHRGEGYEEIGSLNLPWCKQRTRARRARRAMERWLAASPDNQTILLYTLYLPYLQAAVAIKRKHPDVRLCVIVTDLPNELGIASGRTGLFKRVEYARGTRSLRLAQQLDGFVLLTAPMAEALQVENRPWMVLEGLVAEHAQVASEAPLPDDPRPAFLYTGTLNRELGIGLLLEAFAALPEAQLWLCGRGDMDPEVSRAVEQYPNIHAFGFVPQAVALAMQSRATALINPRTSEGVFTRYSFPSKTLEYLRAGKPVLCCKLEGIPDAYDPYLCYMEPQTAQGFQEAAQALLSMPSEQRDALGARARDFALREKNNVAQGARLLDFLRTLTVVGVKH